MLSDWMEIFKAEKKEVICELSYCFELLIHACDVTVELLSKHTGMIIKNHPHTGRALFDKKASLKSTSLWGGMIDIKASFSISSETHMWSSYISLQVFARST